jgi:hypothetical protein
MSIENDKETNNRKDSSPSPCLTFIKDNYDKINLHRTCVDCGKEHIFKLSSFQCKNISHRKTKHSDNITISGKGDRLILQIKSRFYIGRNYTRKQTENCFEIDNENLSNDLKDLSKYKCEKCRKEPESRISFCRILGFLGIAFGCFVYFC